MDENKRLIASFFEHFSAGRIEDAFALVDDEAAWWVPGSLVFSGTKSKTEYMAIVERIGVAFPGGLKLTAHQMTGEDDRVAVEVESYGEHVNGKIYANKYHFLFVVRASKIISVKEYMDTLHLREILTN